MAKVTLKDNDTVLKVNGIGLVDKNNLTEELYNRLVRTNERYKEYFNIEGEEQASLPEAKPEKKLKTKLNTNEHNDIQA